MTLVFEKIGHDTTMMMLLIRNQFKKVFGVYTESYVNLEFV